MTPDFRFTLSNDYLGTQEISVPIGWEDCAIVLDRDPTYHDLVENFEGEFVFYGTNGTDDGGVDFLRACIEAEGVRTVVNITIDLSFNSGRTWQNLFNGRVDLSLKEDMRGPKVNKIKAPIIRDDFWALFKNNVKKSVDLKSAKDIFNNDVDPLEDINIYLPSQVVTKLTIYEGHSGEADTVLPCATSTTANITLSGLQLINGIQTTEGMRVFVNFQTDQKQNGPYNASAGSWTRTTDANTSAEFEGMIVSVTGGVSGQGTYKQRTTPVTLGSSNLIFTAYNYVDDVELIDWPDSVQMENTQETEIFYTQAAIDPTVKEIENSYDLGFGVQTNEDDIIELLEIEGESGTLVLNSSNTLKLRNVGFVVHEGPDNPIEITQVIVIGRLYYRLNDDTPVLLDTETRANPVTQVMPPLPPYEFEFDETFNFSLASSNVNIEVQPSDRVRLYIKYEFVWDIDTDTDPSNYNTAHLTKGTVYGGIVNSFISFQFLSTILPTNHEGFFVHDVGGGIADRILGESGLFYSEYLGNQNTKYRAYPEDGDFSFYANLRGLQLRQYSLSEKPFFITWEKFWNGIANIVPIGLRVGEIEGNKKLIVGPLSDFYDSASTSAQLENIPLITYSYDMEKFYKQVRIGYQKWESEDVGGIDDPQTKRTYSAKFDVFGKEIDILSEFIAASLAIEVTRRNTRVKSADYKYDEDVFIIALKQDGVWSPCLDEKFSSVENLNNASTRYNIELSVAYNMLRFLKWLSGCLKEYPADEFTFTSGEGNFKMESTLDGGSEVIENQDMPVDENSYFFPEFAEFDYPLGWERYIQIRDNKYKAVEGSTSTTNFEKFLTQKLSLKPAKGGLSYKGWKVNP